MCGRFVNYLPDMTEWQDLIKIQPDVNLSYNVAPEQTIAAFRSPAGKAMRWGLIPHWAKEFSSEFATFKAQIETLHEKPAYRDAWYNNHRCIIPMRGYYEWQGEKGNKQPYYISSEKGKVLVVAGLYDQWGSDKKYSCTVITKPADEQMQEIHPRMPVLLTPQSAKQWMKLDKNVALDYLKKLEKPALSYHKVSKSVGNVKSNGRRLIVPID